MRYAAGLLSGSIHPRGIAIQKVVTSDTHGGPIDTSKPWETVKTYRSFN